MKTSHLINSALLGAFLCGCGLKIDPSLNINTGELDSKIALSTEAQIESKTIDALTSMGRFCVIEDNVLLCPKGPYTPTFSPKSAVKSLEKLYNYSYQIEAKTIGMKLLPVFDSSPELLVFMGMAYEKEHDAKGAGLLYTHALHLDPLSENANFGNARCLLAQKKLPQALRHAKKARERTGLRQKEADDLIRKIEEESKKLTD